MTRGGRRVLTGASTAGFSARSVILAALAVVVVLALLPLPAYELFRPRSLLRPTLWPVVVAVVLGAVAPWGRVRPMSSTAAGVTMVWLLFVLGAPSHPRWHFARDVGLLAPGMPRDAADAVLADHAEGMFAQGLQPWPRKTYYEPRDEHHSGDEFAVVTWDGDRIADISYSKD